jgi:3-hydroxymyristoyl/3-hydroxydecanoyl-(acyl carrier protein) dehydratase
VPADHPSLPGHFPGNPIVPGVLLLDCVGAGLEQATGRRMASVPKVKFASVLRPDEHALALCEVDGNNARFSVVAQRDGASVTLASGKLTLQANDDGPIA